jgi:outer membrane lipoprotein
MKRPYKKLPGIMLIFSLLLLTACASTPEFSTEGVNLDLQPSTAADQLGQKVIWGGTIIDIRNLADKTRLEVLSYPLTDTYRPQVKGSAKGRFIVEKAGYLEAREFRPGKVITVSGTLLSSQSGKIGDAEYLYPVVEAARLKLWKERSTPRLHFGIGIGINN